MFSGRLNAVVETEPFVMKLQSRAGQRLVAMARVNLEPNVSSFVFFMTVSYFLINAMLCNKPSFILSVYHESKEVW